MTWNRAMHWALLRAGETRTRRRVKAYRHPSTGAWCYMVGQANRG